MEFLCVILGLLLAVFIVMFCLAASDASEKGEQLKTEAQIASQLHDQAAKEIEEISQQRNAYKLKLARHADTIRKMTDEGLAALGGTETCDP